MTTKKYEPSSVGAPAPAAPPDPKVVEEEKPQLSPLGVLRECLRVNPNESAENLLAALDAAGYVLDYAKVRKSTD